MKFDDLVITGADIYCGDAGRTWADAIAVSGGRITALGTEAEVRARVGAAHDVLHLPGRMVVPGFQDAHIHPAFGGRNRLTVDLRERPGVPAYLDAIRDYAEEHPEQEWIVGGGWAMEHFPNGIPTRHQLDAVVPDRPVFLFNRDVHGAWLNTRALERGGITAQSPDPADGRIERDPAGEPVGTLQEGAAYWFNEHVVPAPSSQDWDAALLEAQALLHSVGITAWQDAWVTQEIEAAYRRLAASEQLTAHVVGALWWDRHRGLEQIEEFIERRAQPVHGAGFAPRAVKIMTDGVLENHTAALLDPYGDGCGLPTANHGLAYLDREELAEAVAGLDAHGFQVHMHAIGDRAVRNSLDAVQVARRRNGARGNRHHVAHLQVIQREDLRRFRDLAVVANCQTYFVQADQQMQRLTIPYLGPERTQLQFPFADLVRGGAVVALGSDWPVTTPDPLAQIEVALTHRDPGARDMAMFLPDQTLTLPEALAGYTIGVAYGNHDDHRCGSLEVGKRADLAVLDQNLFDIADGQVADAQVELTISAGQVVYESRAAG